jgi:hypothetical protein
MKLFTPRKIRVLWLLLAVVGGCTNEVTHNRSKIRGRRTVVVGKIVSAGGHKVIPVIETRDGERYPILGSRAGQFRNGERVTLRGTLATPTSVWKMGKKEDQIPQAYGVNENFPATCLFLKSSK